MNFIEPDLTFNAEVMLDPIPASDNGVFVAHPIDLARMKTLALYSRKAARDYLDFAAFAEHAPNELLEALKTIAETGVVSYEKLALALMSPPHDVSADIPAEAFEKIVRFTRDLLKTPDDGVLGHTELR